MNEIDIFVTQLCMVWQLTLVVMEMKYKLVHFLQFFLVVNGVVYECVSSPIVLIAECFMISEILLIKVLLNLM